MKHNLTAGYVITLLAMALTLIPGCMPKTMSLRVEDTSKGLNGSFEYCAGTVPVNWQLYTAQTVPKGDFDVEPDTSTRKDGNQSLKFTVRACDAAGGWYSPGIAAQLDANAGEQFKITFWIKNQGATYKATVSGVSATRGQAETIVNSAESMTDWKFFEHTYTIPPKMNALRFELNVLSAGQLWVDDVRIVKL